MQLMTTETIGESSTVHPQSHIWWLNTVELLITMYRHLWSLITNVQVTSSLTVPHCVASG